jgi:UDP-N-acetylglucosamine--N-acetylmuramyl-(pentapeptide) pyrophosphoryl-undecaprenol N-acetylglucosamine transferase
LPEAAQNHQIKNAYAYENSGACVVIEEKNLTPHFFLEKLKYLSSKPELLREMSVRAEVFSRPRAAEIITKYIIEYLIY